MKWDKACKKAIAPLETYEKYVTFADRFTDTINRFLKQLFDNTISLKVCARDKNGEMASEDQSYCITTQDLHFFTFLMKTCNEKDANNFLNGHRILVTDEYMDMLLFGADLFVKDHGLQELIETPAIAVTRLNMKLERYQYNMLEEYAVLNNIVNELFKVKVKTKMEPKELLNSYEECAKQIHECCVKLRETSDLLMRKRGDVFALVKDPEIDEILRTKRGSDLRLALAALANKKSK